MRTRTTAIALGVIAAVFVIDAVRGTGAPNPSGNPALRLEAQTGLPTEVADLLQRACYDCHSHETRWPGYLKVAPAAWLVVKDVNEGRGQLNFSRWAIQSVDRADQLDEACKMVREGKMPLKPTS